MYLRCCNEDCNKLLMDDIFDNLTIDCSTNIKLSVLKQSKVAIEIKCIYCHMFMTIFEGGDDDGLHKEKSRDKQKYSRNKSVENR